MNQKGAGRHGRGRLRPRKPLGPDGVAFSRTSRAFGSFVLIRLLLTTYTKLRHRAAGITAFMAARGIHLKSAEIGHLWPVPSRALRHRRHTAGGGPRGREDRDAADGGPLSSGRRDISQFGLAGTGLCGLHAAPLDFCDMVARVAAGLRSWVGFHLGTILRHRADGGAAGACARSASGLNHVNADLLRQGIGPRSQSRRTQ